MNEKLSRPLFRSPIEPKLVAAQSQNMLTTGMLLGGFLALFGLVFAIGPLFSNGQNAATLFMLIGCFLFFLGVMSFVRGIKGAIVNSELRRVGVVGIAYVKGIETEAMKRERIFGIKSRDDLNDDDRQPSRLIYEYMDSHGVSYRGCIVISHNEEMAWTKMLSDGSKTLEICYHPKSPRDHFVNSSSVQS